MQFRKAASIKDLEVFCNIWMPEWIKVGFELESYITEGIERFIISTDEGEDFGSLELIPYSFDLSPVNETFPFNKFEILKDKRVAEIDKFAIAKEYQGSIKNLVGVIDKLCIYLIVEKKYDYIITLLNPLVYVTIVKRLRIPNKRLEGVLASKVNYIPVLFNRQEITNSPYGKRILSEYITII